MALMTPVIPSTIMPIPAVQDAVVPWMVDIATIPVRA